MPKREVHIFAAASGAGKTTYMLQILDDLIEGLPVFDAPTHPISPVYLCNDRSRDDFQRTLDRVKLRNSFPCYSILTDPEFAKCATPHDSIRRAKTLHPECDFVAFDPISYNVENINSAKEVSRLLRSLTNLCHEIDVTTQLVHHNAKVKTEAGYAQPRQRMAGCGAWGGFSNLNLIFEEEDEKDPTNPFRTLYICPRNGEDRTYRLMKDGAGCFCAAPRKEEDPVKRRHLDDQIFNSLTHGEHSISQFFDALGGRTNGVVYRNIERWIKLGCLEKGSRRGQYTKIKNCS